MRDVGIPAPLDKNWSILTILQQFGPVNPEWQTNSSENPDNLRAMTAETDGAAHPSNIGYGS
jgi:hypothetical protein